MSGQQQHHPVLGQQQPTDVTDVDEEALEVSSELDDALNELGMLSSSSGAAMTSNDILSRKDLLKEKLRRGMRYPLRREKEREVSWSSSSSSGSVSSSSGYSSRRSSNSSVGSFSSLRSSHVRSPLMTQCSIAETPTGVGPGMTCFSMTSSNLPSAAQTRRGIMTSQMSCCSSYGSSSELFVDPFSSTSSAAFKSNNIQKGIRRYQHHHRSNYKPYGGRRRFSLNINAKDRMAAFTSSGSGDSLPLRSGLSDSEASSGSGTGTPPPGNYGQQHRPISLTTSGINPSYFSNIFKSNFPTQQNDLQFQETKSNPSSPVRDAMTTVVMSDVNTQQQVQSRVIMQRRIGDSSAFCNMPCPLNGPSLVHTSYGTTVLTRSKSLDDLISISFISDDSSSSTDCFGTNALRPTMAGAVMTANSSMGFCQQPPHHPAVGVANPSSQFSLYSTLTTGHQLQETSSLNNASLSPLNAFSMSCHVRNSQGLPLHHHSHHHLLPSSSSNSAVSCQQQQPIESGEACDNHLLENVLQGMTRLEMN